MFNGGDAADVPSPFGCFGGTGSGTSTSGGGMFVFVKKEKKPKKDKDRGDRLVAAAAAAGDAGQGVVAPSPAALAPSEVAVNEGRSDYTFASMGRSAVAGASAGLTPPTEADFIFDDRHAASSTGAGPQARPAKREGAQGTLMARLLGGHRAEATTSSGNPTSGNSDSSSGGSKFFGGAVERAAQQRQAVVGGAVLDQQRAIAAAMLRAGGGGGEHEEVGGPLRPMLTDSFRAFLDRHDDDRLRAAHTDGEDAQDDASGTTAPAVDSLDDEDDYYYSAFVAPPAVPAPDRSGPLPSPPAVAEVVATTCASAVPAAEPSSQGERQLMQTLMEAIGGSGGAGPQGPPATMAHAAVDVLGQRQAARREKRLREAAAFCAPAHTSALLADYERRCALRLAAC